MSKFSELNSFSNLQPRIFKRTSERKVFKKAVQDAVREEIALAQNAEGIANVASKYGLSDEWIFERAKSANNIGQFSMCVTNSVRGILRRKDQLIAAGKTEEEAKEAAIDSRSFRRAIGGKAREGAKFTKPAKVGRTAGVQEPKAKKSGRGGRKARSDVKTASPSKRRNGGRRRIVAAE